ncbi:MAG: hypothetical protein HY843_08905 [Bdellovibrio sp.]|nr:hypothetical protein [Bdellovibrio sp.]
MENENLTPKLASDSFTTGACVIYALHGKCTITAVETKEINNQVIDFYKLEPQKSPIQKNQRHDTSIWLPVLSAKSKGLRLPMAQTETQEILQVLSNGEHYFPINEKWSIAHTKLEKCILIEGAQGLAKALSYLSILKKKMVILPTEITKFHETVFKLLCKELSDATNEPLTMTEEKVNKNLKQKISSFST